MIRALILALGLGGPVAAGDALPFALGGSFTLLDQHGEVRTAADPHGHAQLLFFGYANCPGICATAMPMMAEAVEAMAEVGIPLQPVMITVDPKRDRVGNMEGPLLDVHPDFIGLTGSEAALEQAYKAFGVERTLAFTDPEYGDVFTHGSLVYLLDGDGRVLTLLPPILDSAHVAGVIRGYLAPGQG